MEIPISHFVGASNDDKCNFGGLTGTGDVVGYRGNIGCVESFDTSLYSSYI